MTQAISLIILLISTSLVTPGVEAADDEVKDTAVCTTQSQTLKLDCGDAAKIEMVSGYYAHDKSDRACSAGGPHWESNSCMQFSDTLGEKLKDECNGQSSCDVGSGAYDPYNFSEDIPTEWYDCSLDKRIEPGQAKSRNVVGARYKCIKYEFCKEFSGKHSTLKVTSENYPENSVTNPTCGCTFSRAQGTGVFVKLFMECKASMTVTTVETFSNGTSIEREYLCGGGPYTLIGGSKIASIELKADPSRSPEHSAYFVTAAMYSSEDLRLVQAEVEVSCVAGKLYLPYSTQLGLMIGLPLLVIFLVAAIVLYCICKNRRKKAKAWRRENIKLPSQKRKRTPGAAITMSQIETERPREAPRKATLETPQPAPREISRRQPPSRSEIEPAPIHYAAPSVIQPTPTTPQSERTGLDSERAAPVPAVRTHHVEDSMAKDAHNIAKKRETGATPQRYQRQPSTLERNTEKPSVAKKPASLSRNSSKHSMRPIDPVPLVSPMPYADSFERYEDDRPIRYEPEGDDDEEPEEMEDLILQLDRKNKARRQAELAKRHGYSMHDSPLPIRRHLDAHAPNRAHSLSNISHRRPRNQPHQSTLPTSSTQPTLAGTRSASNSRTSLRSMKRRAPPPPTNPHTIGAPEARRPGINELYAAQPVAQRPSHLYTPDSILPPGSGYATPQRVHPPTAEPSAIGSDEETDIMRSGRPLLPPKTNRRRANLPAPPPKPQRSLHYNDSLDSPGSEPISY